VWAAASSQQPTDGRGVAEVGEYIIAGRGSRRAGGQEGAQEARRGNMVGVCQRASVCASVCASDGAPVYPVCENLLGPLEQDHNPARICCTRLHLFVDDVDVWE
jgi:hypothetical protein